jgi:hypothetical protein
MEQVKRLFWKEAIRSWPLLAAGVVLPAFVFGWLLPRLQRVPPGYPPIHHYDVTIITAILGLLMLAVTVWAVMTAGSERYRQSYVSAHFPVTPSIAPLIGFGMQLLLGAAIGFSIGAWFMHIGSRILQIDYLLAAVVMLYFSGNAGVSFVVTQALSPAAGIAAGLCWMLGNIGVRNLLIGEGSIRSTSILQFSEVAFPAILVSLAILLLPGRLGRRARQIVSCAVLAVVLLGFPIIKPILDSRRPADNKLFLPFNKQITSPDGALAIAYLDRFVPLNSTSPFRLRLELTDYPRQWTAETTFDAPVLLVGFAGHDAVILAEQRAGEQQITLLRWDRFSDAPRPLFSFTAQRGALLRKLPAFDTFDTSMVSPDGRYGLLVLPSLFSDYFVSDIWLLDLARNRAKLVIPAIFSFNTSIGWQEQKAILMRENGNQYQIDLPGGKVERTLIEEERR